MTFYCTFCDSRVGFDPAGQRNGEDICASCKARLGTSRTPFGVTD